MSFYEGMRVAVIGGAGMIGSHLVELLVEAGADVLVMDNLSRGRMSNLEGVLCEFRHTNAVQSHDLYDLVDRDAVFNLAARVTGMHYNRKHHAEMFYQNLLLQTVPLSLCAEAGVPLYAQVSTVCVYPHNVRFPALESEGHRGDPESTNAGYGWAKRMGERYAQWVAAERSIKIAITRFSNCFGPRDYFDEETSHVIPALIKRTLEDEVVKVYGTGEPIREFLLAKDAATGLMKVLQHYPEADPVNIGNPHNRVSIKELALLIQDVIGVKKLLTFDTSLPDGYPRRGSNIDKLVEKTGWLPEPNLMAGLKATVEWYLKHTEA